MNGDSRQGIIASLPALEVRPIKNETPLHGFRFDQIMTLAPS